VTPTGTPAPNDSSGWNDPADAIYTAARYLQSSGAPGDWNGAIFAYNHAAWYVSEVDRNAAHYPSAAGGQATVDVSAIITSSTADTTSASQPPTTACAPVGSGPTVPGEVAQIQPDGTAAIPAGPPPQVQQAIAAGDRIVDTFYSQERRTSMLTHLQDSYDCSGSTDFLLYNAGLNSPKVDIGIQTAGDSLLLEQYGQSGPGQWITIYAKPGHAFIEVAGLVMDTAWYAPVRPASVPDSYPRDDPANGGPASGPRWQPASIIQAQIHGDTYGFFVKRHPPGL